jgi:hypothetical protein
MPLFVIFWRNSTVVIALEAFGAAITAAGTRGTASLAEIRQCLLPYGNLQYKGTLVRTF